MRTLLLVAVLGTLLVTVTAVDAQQLYQVTKSTVKNMQGPRISPDADMIIWGEQDTGNTYNHYIYSANISNPTSITPKQITFSPQHSSSLPAQWQISGDGKTVVFVSGYDLWKIPSTGGTPTQLTTLNGPPGIVNAAYPISLSHDGRLACFTYFFYQSSPTTIRTYDLYVLDTTTKQIVNITKSPANSNDLSMGWISGDGRTVAFTQYRGGSAREVWLAAADGTNLHQVTTFGAVRAFHPKLDTSATMCIFSAWPASNYNIYSATATGSLLTTISRNPTGHDYDPSFSADGERVAWKSDQFSSGDIAMVYPEGGIVRQVTPFGDIQPLYGNAGHALNGDGTKLVCNTKANYQGGNPDGNFEIFLWVDALTKSGTAGPGKTVTFQITAPAHAGEFYQMACSFFRKPGFQLGSGWVPLNPDALFFLSMALPPVFQNFSNVLDANGKATARIVIPNAPISGLAFYTSFVTVDKNNAFSTFNPVKVTIQ